MSLFVIIESSHSVEYPHAAPQAYSNKDTAIQKCLERALRFVIDNKKAHPELDIQLEQATDGMTVVVTEPNGNVWLDLFIDEVTVNHSAPDA